MKLKFSIHHDPLFSASIKGERKLLNWRLERTHRYENAEIDSKDIMDLFYEYPGHAIVPGVGTDDRYEICTVPDENRTMDYNSIAFTPRNFQYTEGPGLMMVRLPVGFGAHLYAIDDMMTELDESLKNTERIVHKHTILFDGNDKTTHITYIVPVTDCSQISEYLSDFEKKNSIELIGGRKSGINEAAFSPTRVFRFRDVAIDKRYSHRITQDRQFKSFGKGVLDLGQSISKPIKNGFMASIRKGFGLIRPTV